MLQTTKTAKQRFKRLSAKTAIAVLVGLLYYAVTSYLGFGIPCVFRMVTGLKCPGCGVSRMAISLIELDFKSAFEYNAVILCSLPFLAVVFGQLAVRYVKNGDARMKKWQTITVVVLVIVLILFGISRNVLRRNT